MEESQQVEARAEAERKDRKGWYEKNYKLLLIIPVSFLVFSLAYLGLVYARTGDIINKDVTLSGGSTITVYTEKPVTAAEVEAALRDRGLNDVVVRILTDLRTGRQVAFTVESKAEPAELKASLADFLGYELTDENSSVEFTGASLSRAFYSQLLLALAFAFALMAVTVFLLFKRVLPSVIVILTALTDIVAALAITNIAGIRLSTAGIAAFLMLIGYSVDTDVMLTNRILKRREGSLGERQANAFRTGITMTLTSLAALGVAYFVVISPVLKQVFFVLLVGLTVDMATTWLGNATALRWYCEKKGMG